ncbi:hypothetical protein ACP4OV_027888 [Aristida adscensionis]
MLGVANDVGENFGVVAGVLCNSLPPWLVLLTGAAFCFLGFGTLWLAVSGTVLAMPYWLLWSALAIGTSSNVWFVTAVLVTNMRNFPRRRGGVAGILKGYVGLSAALFTQVFSGVLHRSPAGLLLLLAVGLPVVCLATMYYVRPCTPALGAGSDEEEDAMQDGHFAFAQAASAALGAAPSRSPAPPATRCSPSPRAKPPAASTGEEAEEPLLVPSHGAAADEDADEVAVLLAECGIPAKNAQDQHSVIAQATVYTSQIT